MRKFQPGCPCCNSCILFRDSFDAYPNGTFTDPYNRYQFEQGNLVVADGKMTNGHDDFSLLSLGPTDWFGKEPPERVEVTLSAGAGLITWADFDYNAILGQVQFLYFDGTHLYSRKESEVFYKYAVPSEEIEEDGSIRLKVWNGVDSNLAIGSGCTLSLDGSTNCGFSQVMFKSGLKIQVPGVVFYEVSPHGYRNCTGIVFLEENAWADNLILAYGAADRDDCEIVIQELSGITPPQIFYEPSYLTYTSVPSGEPGLPLIKWDVVPSTVTIELGATTYGDGSIFACPEGFDCALSARTYELDYVGSWFPNGFFSREPENAVVWISRVALQGDIDDPFDNCAVGATCFLQLSYRDPFILQWRFVYTMGGSGGSGQIGQYVWLSETTHDIRTDTNWATIWDLAHVAWGSPTNSDDTDYCGGGAPEIVSMSIS